MANAVRYSDLCSGHDSHPPRPNIEASPDVLVDGLGSVRVGDAWAKHPHGGVSSGGSNTVFINNQNAVRVGDPISCGSVAAQGSQTVMIG